MLSVRRHGPGHWRRRTSHALGCAMLVVAGVACSGEHQAPTEAVVPIAQPQQLVALTVRLDAPAVTMGQIVRAVVTGVDQHGMMMTVGVPAWRSETPAIASIGADGIVLGVSPGQATLVAAIGAVQGEVKVVVNPYPPGPVPVALVAVNPMAATIEAGKLLQLTVTPTDFLGVMLPDRNIVWSSSAPAVATVSSNGLVTAFTTGVAIIEATCEGVRGALALTVTAATDTDLVVSIAQPLPFAIVGDTVTVIATVHSTFPVTRVVTSVAGKETAMTYGHVGGGERAMGWSATLNLSLLAFGPWDLVVSATDTRDHLGATSVHIVRNPSVNGGGKPPTGNK